MIKKRPKASDEEKLYLASQYQLMWRRFRKHKLAIIGIVTLTLLYLVGALFCEFFATQDIFARHSKYIYCPPQRIRFFEQNGRFHLRPFVYGITRERNTETFAWMYGENTAERYPLSMFIRGDEYKLWGLFKSNIHLFGAEKPGLFFIFGTDKLGRDLYSRTLYAARVSLTIGLIGITFSFVLGCFLGGLSGYYGGATDTIIQRLIEFLISIPTLPLWMSLAAAIPSSWPSLRVYFAITIILSIVGWCGLGRVVRGKLISLREEDFVLAAQISGVPEYAVILKHLLPSFLSYLIVNLTLSIPMMILGETALSFLGLGLQPPVVSWGVLLNEAQNVKAVSMNPWLLIPGLFVIVTVLAFNFMGDGLRDAADPYTG